MIQNLLTLCCAVCLLLTAILVAAVVVRKTQQTLPHAKRFGRRGLYCFNDGINDRMVDPIEVLMALVAHPEYLINLHPRMVANGNAEAIRITIDAIKSAFKVLPYESPDLPGLTNREMLGLLSSFYRYIDLQKKSTNRSPISARSTDATSKISEENATPSTLDSGSIDLAPEASKDSLSPVV